MAGLTLVAVLAACHAGCHGGVEERCGGARAAARGQDVPAGEMTEPVVSGGAVRPGEGGVPGGPAHVASAAASPSALADAAALGIPTLAGVVAGEHAGVAIYDAEGRFVYANPAACEILGMPLERLRGRDILDSIAARERAFALARYTERQGRSLGELSGLFTYTVSRPDGTEREVMSHSFPVDIAGSEHGVTIFRDVTDTRAAGRTATALAQSAAQLVGTATTDEILAGITRHAAEGTRALSCGISVVRAHSLASAGGYAKGYDQKVARAVSARWVALGNARGEAVIEAMAAGSIHIGDAPGKPVVLPDARSRWEANPITSAFATTLGVLDWQAGVFVPMSWDNRVFGLFGAYLPSGLDGPSEAELAFYTALADQAAVVVASARRDSRARQAAAALERTRLARELHDSVSQALFSMTMHARAAQLSMARAGLARDTPLGRSVAELAELTRGALAEMRALIFELRPTALAEEGLVSALRKQAAALSARDQVAITVDGPEQRLELPAEAEEHLYRIATEALHNVARHARARSAEVRVTANPGVVRAVVSDDGAGFDPGAGRPGHLGLSTMTERARLIGADLTITSAPGAGTTVAVSVPAGRPDHGRAGPGGR